MSDLRRRTILGMVAAGLVAGVTPALASSLRGSEYSVQKQYLAAQRLNLTPVRSTKDVQKFVANGILVPMPGNEDYELGSVSFPYARPATRSFIEKLAAEYRAFTGERLVVTSLTRPLSRQPRNASSRSVHPMGIAADIRRPHDPKARRWIEQKLRTLEAEGVIEATHERRPPHYHVAVFPDKIETYAGTDRPARDLVAATPAPATPAKTPGAVTAAGPGSTPSPSAYGTYSVRRGDTLWTIAARFDTTVSRIRKINGLRSSRIYPGQKLMVPQGS